MNQDHQSRITVAVDEYYVYTVKLGIVPVIEWKKSMGIVQLQVPYDGRLQDAAGQALSERAYAGNQDVPGDALAMGELCLTLPDNDHVQTHPVALPLHAQDHDMATLLKSGQSLEWTTTYTPPAPAESLFSIDGHISDSAGPRKEYTERISLVAGKDKAFTNDLYLYFDIWVPNLLRNDVPQLREARADRIFITDLTKIDHLAHSMAALANSGGGQIVIGMDERGYAIPSSDQRVSTYRNQVYTALVKAGLQCTPPFPLQQPDESPGDIDGQVIFQVDIPKGLSAVYTVKGWTYVRDGAKTVARRGNLNTDRDPVEAVRVPALNDIVQALDGNHPEMLVIAPTSLQDVCCYLSGLINAQVPATWLIVRNPPTITQKNVSQPKARMRVIEQDLRHELRSCVPSLDTAAIQVVTIGDEIIVVIAISDRPPVALYGDRGYVWKDGQVYQLSIREVLSRYTGWSGGDPRAASFGQVRLESGKLQWHLQPAALTKHAIHTFQAPKTVPPGTYDPLAHAFVWQSANFTKEVTNGGWHHAITAPLQHILVQLNAQGKITDSEPLLTGELRLCLDDVLVSGIQVKPQHFAPNNIVSMGKRTHMCIQFEVDTQQLFKRRLRRAYMDFHLLNAALAPEHIHALWRTFADLGFRITAPPPAALAHGESLTLFGRQHKQFYDLTLEVQADVKTINVNREMRYATYSEHKQTQLQTLHLGVLLSGKGEDVYREMARLYRDMHRLLNERMRYLGTE